MAGILQVGSRPLGRSVAAAATIYWPLGVTTLENTGVEATVTVICRTAGTYTKLYISVPTNTFAGTGTVRFRKNTANGNQSASIPATTTGEFQDSVNSDAVVSGDNVDYLVTTGAGANSFTVYGITTVFTATTNTVTKLIQNNNTAATTSIASTTRFMGAAGSALSDGTETRTQFKSRTVATVLNFYIDVLANARTSATTFGSRKNTANGNLVVSVPIAGTGVFEDTVNTDTLASGDLFNYYSATGAGVGAVSWDANGTDFSTTNGKSHCLSSGINGAIAAATTTYYPIGGDQNVNATESLIQLRANVPHVASNLECHLSLNTVTAASTLTFRKNGGNGNQSVSITASTTGFFEDTVNTDTILTADELDYQLTTGATGTSLTMNTIGYLITATAVKSQAGLFWSYPI